MEHVYGCCPVVLATPMHAPFGAAVDALIVPVYVYLVASVTTVTLSFGQSWYYKMLSTAFWRVLARHGCLCVHSLYDVQQLQHPHSHSLMPGYLEHPSIASLQSLYQRVISSICFFAVVVPMFRSPCMTAYLHWYIPWHGTVKRDVFFLK